MTVAQDLAPDLLALPWRTGDLGDLVVLAQAGGGASRRDLLVGIMASGEIAAEVCRAHNAGLVVHPWAAVLNRLIRERLLAAERP